MSANRKSAAKTTLNESRDTLKKWHQKIQFRFSVSEVQSDQAQVDWTSRCSVVRLQEVDEYQMYLQFELTCLTCKSFALNTIHLNQFD